MYDALLWVMTGCAALKKFLDDELSHLDMDSEFHYCHWQTADCAPLTTLTMTFKEYKEPPIDSINNLTRHSYLVKAQARYMKLKRESLGQMRLWCLGTSQRTSSVRSRTRYKAPTDCTLHPLVIYCKDADGNLQHYETLFHFRWQHPGHQFSSQDSDTTGWILEAELKIYYVSDGCVGNIKFSGTSLIYVSIKRIFPSKQSGFSF